MEFYKRLWRARKEEVMNNQEIEYRKMLNKLVITRNCISLICFTVLAIVFKTWWIVFFAIIFTSYIGKDEE